MVNGSCSWRPDFEGECWGFREAFLANVEVRKRDDHWTRGEEERVGLVVWDWKSVAGRRCFSVISVLHVNVLAHCMER